MQRPFISTQGSGSRYRRSTPCRPSPTTPAQKSPKLKTFRNPIGKNHKFKINDLHKQYFSSNRYLCKRIKYIIYFSHAHRFGHCSQLLSCSLSRAAYRKYSATNVSGLRTDSAIIRKSKCSTDFKRNDFLKKTKRTHWVRFVHLNSLIESCVFLYLWNSPFDTFL